MKIMIGILHPKQVHSWKNVIRNLENDGHEVKIVAMEKDIALYLLDAYCFEYEVIGKNYKGLMKKAYGMLKTDVKVLKVARKFKPDILVGGGPYLAHVSKIIGKPCITFSDTEHAKLNSWLTFPFANVVCTPSCFKRKVNPKKHVTYNGYIQLAYLHPNYFKPDPGVLDDLGLSKDDKFIILRFVSWSATHDVNQHGIDEEIKSEYVSKLEQHGRVFISSEAKMVKQFEKYKLKIAPEKFHSLLSYAQLYIGESGAISTEAGILGTASIYVSSLAGTMGNLKELENKYKLIYSFNDPRQALNKALLLLEEENLKASWQKKREKLLYEKIDVTKFMTEFIENYPESFYKREQVTE